MKPDIAKNVFNFLQIVTFIFNNEMKMINKISTPYFMAPEIFGDEEDKITKKSMFILSLLLCYHFLHLYTNLKDLSQRTFINLSKTS